VTVKSQLLKGIKWENSEQKEQLNKTALFFKYFETL